MIAAKVKRDQIMAVTDLLCLYFSYKMAGWLAPDQFSIAFQMLPFEKWLPWLLLIGLFSFYMFGAQSITIQKPVYIMIPVLFSVLVCTGLILLVTTVFSIHVSRSIIFLAGLIQFGLITSVRMTVAIGKRRKYKRKKFLILSQKNRPSSMIYETLIRHVGEGLVVEEIWDWNQRMNLSQLLQTINRKDIVLFHSDLPGKEEIIHYCSLRMKEVVIIPNPMDLFITSSELEQIDDMLVLSIHPSKLNGWRLVMKRMFDIGVSVLLLLLLSPLIVTLYLIIPRLSPGPALFKQIRLGKDGKPFQMLKFRSMIVDAEKDTGPVLAMDHDMRVTPIGRILRSTRLDELPQLINVLKGEMSLIGPRPERPYFIEKFTETIPGYADRMTVRPGITGLAQVMGKYSSSVEEKLRYDLIYVRKYSLLLDLKIMIQTIQVIFHKEQASGICLQEQQVSKEA